MIFNFLLVLGVIGFIVFLMGRKNRGARFIGEALGKIMSWGITILYILLFAALAYGGIMWLRGKF